MKLKNNFNQERDKKKIQITIKNEDQTWYKNKKSTKSQGMKLKKKISKKYSRPYSLESKEWWPNLIQ
jgi:hypothetical protein